MDYSQYAGYGGGQYGAQYAGQYGAQQPGQYAYPPGYGGPNTQQQQYQPTAPQIRNPFAAPSVSGAYGDPNGPVDLDESQQLAQWHAAYAHTDQTDRGKKGAKPERGDNANLAPLGQRTVGAEAEAVDAKAKTVDDGNKTVMRKGGGQTWEDKTLLEWDPTHFRIMVGNLAGEVTDDSLAKAFAAYGVSKARVVRDKVTTKSRGFGFVSFFDGELGFKAAREMVGKYIGSHPVTIQRSKTDLKPVIKKPNHRGKNKGKNNRDKGKDKQKDDPLKANTGAGVEKKQPPKVPSGLKLLG